MLEVCTFIESIPLPETIKNAKCEVSFFYNMTHCTVTVYMLLSVIERFSYSVAIKCSPAKPVRYLD